MSLKQLTDEQIKEMAMVEVAYELFVEGKKPYIFSELVEEVSSLLGLTKKQVEDKIAQFYTDINIDGRFICVGENMWGLRTWYPYEQIEEEIVPVAKPKKKKAKKGVEDDLEDDFDVIDEDLDYDDFDDTSDDDDDDDDFDDIDDVDLDDDDDDDLIDDDDEDYDLDDDEDDDEDELDDEEEEK
ncbi:MULTISPECIES: DNA-directed RNA polymerase subunit delta [Metabacillus]|uniref:Probable DNA-directed RNA polymerase subunit delta n=2 Tax=Metabacillus TaxID=2675233 RepID=A0A179T4K7_9BACI|nr:MULTISPECIES: DNA-directed RNA polymerase subunit delta [Metabacillus]OAS88089.1 DNA-directed RNA polymerase subunit delta [Metabacillus litoralis]QNF27481.1 DNA-directed RNA polymerase subunit delta [Metabacillus sp. KUDC1714]